ncbi:MAG: hypothetical protein AAFQ43_06825, partial [Bacteroidota bacterium]
MTSDRPPFSARSVLSPLRPLASRSRGRPPRASASGRLTTVTSGARGRTPPEAAPRQRPHPARGRTPP